MTPTQIYLLAAGLVLVLIAVWYYMSLPGAGDPPKGPAGKSPAGMPSTTRLYYDDSLPTNISANEQLAHSFNVFDSAPPSGGLKFTLCSNGAGRELIYAGDNCSPAYPTAMKHFYAYPSQQPGTIAMCNAYAHDEDPTRGRLMRGTSCNDHGWDQKDVFYVPA